MFMIIPVASEIERPKQPPKQKYLFQEGINKHGEKTVTATRLDEVPIAKAHGYMEVIENKKKQSITQKLKEILQWLIPCCRFNQRVYYINS